MADKCTPVRSSWLTHVGTFGGNFFVAFRNGVCCLYPNTDDSYYQLALTYASKGHYVHEWLYKLLPYILIKNPCPAILAGGVATTCCVNALPRTLHATGNLGIGSVPLTYDGTRYWTGSCAPTCGDTVRLRFECQAGGTTANNLTLEGSCDGGLTWIATIRHFGATCSPLSATFDLSMSVVSGCVHCDSQTATFTVTL